MSSCSTNNNHLQNWRFLWLPQHMVFGIMGWARIQRWQFLKRYGKNYHQHLVTMLENWFLHLTNFMGKVELECVIIIFCHIIIFNKWEEQTKRYDYLEAIHTKKHNNKIIKYLANIGAKLCMFVSNDCFLIGSTLLQNGLGKGKSKSRD